MRYLPFKTILFSSVLMMALGCCRIVGTAMAEDPSFDCGKASGSIEEMICNDDELSALDRKLTEVYAKATQKAINEHPPVLKAEQCGWIKGRNDCWKSQTPRSCAESAYRLRIAELQGRNESFWEHHGEAIVVWGYGSTKMRCKQR